MNRKVWTVVVAMAFALGLAAVGAQQPPPAQETTITGEVIDSGCGQGKGHEECATQCVRDNKSPAAIKNKDGVYVITGDYAANKNAKIVPFVAKDVTAKGVVAKDKDGKLTINVSSIELAK